MAVAVPDQDQMVACALERDGGTLRPIVEQAHAADCGCGKDRAAAARRLALIVERDVAAHDGEVEPAAGVAHATQCLDELSHDFGPLRIAEVQAIGDGKRPCADRAEVAICLRYCLLAALI